MGDKSKKELTDSDLDAVVGGSDANHKQWIEISTVSQGINRDTANTPPTVTTSMTFEEVKPTHKTRD